MKQVLTSLTAIILMHSTSAWAEDIDCNDPQDQASMNICAFEDWQHADKQLNMVWKEVRKALEETDANLPESLRGAQDALLSSQRAWITYRDGTCEAMGFQARGGTLESFIVNDCLARLTRIRTQELTQIPVQFD